MRRTLGVARAVCAVAVTAAGIAFAQTQETKDVPVKDVTTDAYVYNAIITDVQLPSAEESLQGVKYVDVKCFDVMSHLPYRKGTLSFYASPSVIVSAAEVEQVVRDTLRIYSVPMLPASASKEERRNAVTLSNETAMVTQPAGSRSVNWRPAYYGSLDAIQEVRLRRSKEQWVQAKTYRIPFVGFPESVNDFKKDYLGQIFSATSRFGRAYESANKENEPEEQKLPQ